MAEITISDKPCVDCGGTVTLFLIPDKVWDGLGYALRDFACLACVARRLNPKINPSELGEEIYRQRRRFRLKKVNRYGGLWVAICGLAIANGVGVSEMTSDQVGGVERKQKKAA
jgi:hypothetical protein